MIEVWADIQGFDGFYQLSSLAHIRCCVRLGGRGNRWLKGCPWRELKATKNKLGYWKLNLRTPNGKRYYYSLHKLLWETFNGPVPEGYTVDHIDRDTSNCTLENLRLATCQQQTWNRNKETGKTYSKYKGVALQKSYPKKPWVASVHVRGKRIYLGHYATEEEAGLAYNKAALELRGEFACVNDITEELISVVEH